MFRLSYPSAALTLFHDIQPYGRCFQIRAAVDVRTSQVPSWISAVLTRLPARAIGSTPPHHSDHPWAGGPPLGAPAVIMKSFGPHLHLAGPLPIKEGRAFQSLLSTIRSGALLRFGQCTLADVDNPLCKLAGRGDELFRHLERRLDDLLARPTVRHHVGKHTVDSVEKPPDSLQCCVLSILDRFDDAIGTSLLYFRCRHGIPPFGPRFATMWL